MAYDEGPGSRSRNRSFPEILLARKSRRAVLAGGLASAASAFFAGSLALARSDQTAPASWSVNRGKRKQLINFASVKIAEGSGPWPAVSTDYEWDVLIPWGDPLQPGGPAFGWPPTAAAQAEQIGIGHDGMWFFPFRKKDSAGRRFDSNRHGLLEWIAVAPNGDAYCTLTNNSGRTTGDAANPLAPNADGHIIRWRDADQHVGTTFTWDIYLIAKDTHDTEDSFSDPDGLWADPDGRLFIQTDGGQQDGLNNQMLVADPATGDLRRLFTGVTACEITGIAVTPDRRTMFINVQHPGDGDPALTNFPAPPDGVSVPRDATVVLSRKGGGVIGS